MKAYFLNGGPQGAAGSANKSGWMTEPDFVQFMKHFIQNARPSKERKVLLLLDNHSSHLSIPALDLAKENGVVMLSFPPHCSHKLQPLDLTVYGPLKRYVNAACDAFIKNQARPLTIYDIPAVVNIALPNAITPQNIKAGFQAAGISPFNRNIFTDLDFAPSFFSDRDLPPTVIAMDPVLPVELINVAIAEADRDVVLAEFESESHLLETLNSKASADISEGMR